MRIIEIEATWRDWAGATQSEVLCGPPVFKPEHVLFPLADGSYRAEANAQVRGLRWRVTRDETPPPNGLLLAKHQRWDTKTGSVVETRPEQPGDWDEIEAATWRAAQGKS